MTTGARGESTIQLEDREVRVLFTNRALGDAEQQLGRSIIGVSRGLQDGTSGIREIVILLRVGMEAARRDAREGGRSITIPDAYDVLEHAGFAIVTEAVMMAVAAVLSYGTDVQIGDGEDTDPNP